MKLSLPLVASGLLLVTATSRADWPRLRGPDADATAKGSKVPTTWSDTENIKWKVDLPGPGSSSPIIVGDKVFITCWSGYGDGKEGGSIEKLQRHLICLSKADGSSAWDSTVAAVQPEDTYDGFITEHGYASSTPVSDGQNVFVFFGKSGALAFDMDGKQLWQTGLGTKSNSRHWGSGASPILAGNNLIVNALDEGSHIVALDKKTGKQVWESKAEGIELAYGTPTLAGDDLFIAVAPELWCMNPANGKLRWYANHALPGNVSPAPIITADTVYVTGGYPKQGTVAIKRGGTGDTTKSSILWSENNASYVPSPILHEGHLYVINDAGFALCIEAKTGKEVYRERAIDSGGGRGRGKPFYASPVLVDGKLYCPSRKGGTYVLAAKPKFERLAVNTFANDDSQCNATPAVDGNRLYLRTDKALYCIGE